MYPTGVELCGIRGAEEAGEDELLRAGVLGGKKRGVESYGDEAAETGNPTSGRERRCLHGLLAAGVTLLQPDLNYPWVMQRLLPKKLRKTLPRYYSFPFWESV